MKRIVRRMAFTGALGAGVVFALLHSVQADTPAPIQEAIDEIGAAFARQDFDEIKTFFAPDHLVVTTYTGVSPVSEYLPDAIENLDIRSAKVEDHQLVKLGPGVYMRTYYVENQGTFHGKTLPQRVLATQIWVQRDGKWVQRLYQETPLAPK
ncbi:MAG: nuclear transport factor 2 family protein [Pseudomonadota bacterium]